MTSSNLPELKPFIRAFVILGAGISFLVILLTMHTMVLERTREIGILKALGTSRLGILGLIEVEASMMAVIGAVLGLVLTFSAVAILAPFFSHATNSHQFHVGFARGDDGYRGFSTRRAISQLPRSAM